MSFYLQNEGIKNNNKIESLKMKCSLWYLFLICQMKMWRRNRMRLQKCLTFTNYLGVLDNIESS
jgi:hypothetical protein